MSSSNDSLKIENITKAHTDWVLLRLQMTNDGKRRFLEETAMLEFYHFGTSIVNGIVTIHIAADPGIAVLLKLKYGNMI